MVVYMVPIHLQLNQELRMRAVQHVLVVHGLIPLANGGIESLFIILSS